MRLRTGTVWRLALLMLTLYVTSCAPTALSDSACAAFRLLRLSDQTLAAAPRHDLEQLAAHNRTWKQLCR